MEQCSTYAMWLVGPRYGLEQLLVGHERLEAGVVRFRALGDLRPPVFPGAILRAGEELLEQLVLGAHVHVHDAFAQSQLTTSHETLVEGSLRIALREEFDVAIHGLSGWSIHDDVDGDAILGGDDFGVAAEEAEDFLFGQSIRDLWASDLC